MELSSDPKASIAAQQELDNLRRVFVSLDVDADGRLSEADITRVLAWLEYKQATAGRGRRHDLGIGRGLRPACQLGGV